MPSPPPCTRLGRQCRELDVTLRIAVLTEDSATLQDAAATWLLGHTEHVTFGRPYVADNELFVEATVHVPCKHLKVDGAKTNGTAAAAVVRCGVYGFTGKLPGDTRPHPDDHPDFKRDGSRRQVFYKRRIRVLDLPLKRAAQGALPVLQDANPCVDAPCRTADNKHGAACCRDLTIDIVAPRSDTRLEALLRARKSPYLCKVTRHGEDKIECEVISACGYLEHDGISCALHDRVLPNGRIAKPSICYEWPDIGPDEVGHPGCRLL